MNAFYKWAILLLAFPVVMCGCKQEEERADSPRIINIINFIRQTDFRTENADSLLLDCTTKQVALMNKYDMPATYLLQYDALINPAYQTLLKEKTNAQTEIGAWWELNQAHVEAAGMQWKGKHTWVTEANIGFATGYTQEERAKLVDAYMAKFKEVFGYYPKVVGSWYIDAYTLGYIQEHYGIDAACICKDQIGTDGYTFWGGYWNQGYYPSKKNAYMPAQTEAGSIPVPVFRMLGSDPIYQYDNGLGGKSQGVESLEPVYGCSGASRQWVDYFFESIVNQPCLAFSYAQAGQENSFTWAEMKDGLQMQVAVIDSMRKVGRVRLETLGTSGRWYKEQYKVTPATAVTTLTDVKGEGNKTVWFNSRFYRANLLWTKSEFRFRDIHLFDEKVASAYYEQPGEGSRFSFFTLPLVDGYQWSTADELAGLRIVDENGNVLKLENPVVTEPDENTLQVKAGEFIILLSERQITIASTAKNAWNLELKVAAGSALPFKKIAGQQIEATFEDAAYGTKQVLSHDYVIACKEGEFVADSGQGNIAFSIVPKNNRVVIDCTNGRNE